VFALKDETLTRQSVMKEIWILDQLSCSSVVKGSTSSELEVLMQTTL
jgi:hypothetical protein